MLIGALICLFLGVMVQVGPILIAPSGPLVAGCYTSSLAFACLHWRRHRDEERDRQSVRALVLVNGLLLALALLGMLPL